MARLRELQLDLHFSNDFTQEDLELELAREDLYNDQMYFLDDDMDIDTSLWIEPSGEDLYGTEF
jgi:hypothetical protein